MTASPLDSASVRWRDDLSDWEVVRRLRRSSESGWQNAWALAVVIGVHAGRLARGQGGSLAAVTLGTPIGRLGEDAGLSRVAARTAVDRLRAAGVLERGRGFRLSETVLETRIGIGLDGDALLGCLAGETAGLLVCRAHAELAEAPLNEWRPIALADVVERAGYVRRTVQRTRQMLVERGVVESRPSRGGETEFRFATWVLDGGVSARPHDEIRSKPEPAAAPPVVASPTSGATLCVGGVTVEVPPGLRARVEVGVDGRPVVHLEPG